MALLVGKASVDPLVAMAVAILEAFRDQKDPNGVSLSVLLERKNRIFLGH